MKTIKGTQKVWFPEGSCLTLNDVHKVMGEDASQLMGALAFSRPDSEMSKYGWTEIGMAEITIILIPEKEVIEKLADGLRTQIQTVKAEAQNKVNQLEEKLSQLLALPNPDKGEQDE